MGRPPKRVRAVATPQRDALTFVRTLREQRDSLLAQLKEARAGHVAAIEEIDQAVAELGGVGERAVAALAPPVVVQPAAPSSPPAVVAGRYTAARGIKRAPDGSDPVAAEMFELLPWLGILKNDRQRESINLRAGGMAPMAIAVKLSCSHKDVSNDLSRGRRQLQAARAQGTPAEKPKGSSDDDEGEPAPSAAAPAVDWEQLGADSTGYVGPAPAASEELPAPAIIAPPVVAPFPEPSLPRVAAGWDRSDPAEDFTDLPPPKADPAFVHLWMPDSGGTPACTRHFDAQAQLVTDRAEVTCSICFGIEDAPVSSRGEPRPPEWVLGWLSPEFRRAYEGVRLEGLSCETIAWSEDVHPDIIRARAQSARQKVRRLLRLEADRARDGNPMTDADRAPPPAYTKEPDVLLTALGRGREGETPAAAAAPAEDEDEGPELPTLVQVRARISMDGTGRVRAKTISGPSSPLGRLRKDERLAGEELAYPDDVDRPRTRGDCNRRGAARPCPFVSCSHHLYLDVNPGTGAIKLNFPHLEVWEMAETCSLDVADKGGITLEEVGAILNLTRERIRQVEVSGMKKIEASDIELDVAPDRLASPLGAAMG